MDNTKILLVEDEVFLAEIVKESFEIRGYEVHHSLNGVKGLEAFKKFNPDICIFDVMMPEMDGFSLAKEVKKLSPKQPIIFLTAKSMTEDVVEGFELGADDYVRKPFSMEELIMRIKAVLNRRTTTVEVTRKKTEAINISTYVLDPLKQELNHQGEIKKLTSRESELLAILCENKNQLVERDFILKELWGDDSYFNARSMDVFITKIRKHLSKDPDIEIINIRGKGYKIIYP
jgi:DNA-binding response OmpR family regulator